MGFVGAKMPEDDRAVLERRDSAAPQKEGADTTMISPRTGLPSTATEIGSSKPTSRTDTAAKQADAAGAFSHRQRVSRGVAAQAVALTTESAVAETVQGTFMGQHIGLRTNQPDTSVAPANNSAVQERDLFAALDEDRAAATPTWIRAGAHQLEAGFQDPEMGWVAVRAHAETNGVHAALVPSSMEAAQSLGAHLSGLNAYLSDHHSSMQPVTMTAPEARIDRQGFGQSLDQGSQKGNNHQQSHNARAETIQGAPVGRLSRIAAPGQGNEGVGKPGMPAYESRYISVVA
jgi:hypothetical protein